MREISSQTLKDGNYNVEDVMKSIIDTYETRYSEIIKEHENGDREVSYELTGKRSLTLDEDLAGLDEAFKMRLANLEGYITCQQTNRAFANPDSSWILEQTKEIEELEDAFYQARDAYTKLYHESKQTGRPLVLQDFVFGNSQMYEVLDRLGKQSNQ